MEKLLGAFLVALTSACIAPCATAQTAPLQRGISVQLPSTNHAVAVPQADRADSVIVIVTQEGSMYFGLDPIRPAELAGRIKSAFSGGKAKTLYIKADARAPYADVVRVIDAVRSAGVQSLTLLTEQYDSEAPGTMVPPKGLEMEVVQTR